MADITEHEIEQIDRANAKGATPVVFVHGLWLLPTSWVRWMEVFDAAGYAPLALGWPDDPDTVEEAQAAPTAVARTSIGDVADHVQSVIGKLERRPAIVGHSFGGLLTEVLAGRGLSVVSVAVDPAPSRGVLPLPISSLRASRPVAGRPLDRHRAVPLTYDQFRDGFGNALSHEEAKNLHETFAVPAPGKPLFEAAAANLNPWSEAEVDHGNPERGPMLIISGERDVTVPWELAHVEYRKQAKNPGVTAIIEMPDRGHSLTVDSGWREVCAAALTFVQRFAAP
jgi:pimeloyl-ACP methyl ester carboxylesterase